jgi:hypothetical protein
MLLAFWFNDQFRVRTLTSSARANVWRLVAATFQTRGTELIIRRWRRIRVRVHSRLCSRTEVSPGWAIAEWLLLRISNCWGGHGIHCTPFELRSFVGKRPVVWMWRWDYSVGIANSEMLKLYSMPTAFRRTTLVKLCIFWSAIITTHPLVVIVQLNRYRHQLSRPDLWTPWRMNKVPIGLYANFNNNLTIFII